MVHVRRYFAALAVLSALCGVYALAVAPWFEPPPILRRQVSQESPRPVLSHEHRDELARLFPADHWARQEPKVFEMEQCSLLIQNYERLADGRLELKPCVVIFRGAPARAADQNASAAPAGRTIVLEAPKAELSFERPLDLTKAEIGRVKNGRLVGDVTIFGPATLPGGRDELHVRTRAVQIDRQRISTLDEVEFRYGDSSGRGRDLAIEFVQSDEMQPHAGKPKFGGVRTVTLRQLDYLRVTTSREGLLGTAAPNAASNATAPSADAPLELTCRGGAVFDFTSQLAQLHEQVVVRRLVAGAAPDQLRCEQLVLAFGGKQSTVMAAAVAADPLAGRLQRIVATGNPAVLEAPASDVRATAAHMEYTLSDRSLTLKSGEAPQTGQVSLTRLGQHLIARDVHYQMPAPGQGKLGQMQATGPGELRLLQGNGPGQQTIVARWLADLKILPQDNQHAISLLGSASVSVDPLGRLEANELHLWVNEMPQVALESSAGMRLSPTGAQSSKSTMLPQRMLAVGNVRLNSPQLDATTNRLETWFEHLPPELPPSGGAPVPGPIREPPPVQPAAFTRLPQPAASAQEGVRLPGSQKFQVTGDLVRMQLAVRGRKFDLEDLLIQGRAALDEISTPQPGQQPMRMRGDSVEVRQATQPTATLEIVGKPADVSGRGLSLAGNKIEVLRGQNSLLINGPGEATLPAGGTGGDRDLGARSTPPGMSLAALARTSGRVAPPDPNHSQDTLHIVWQQGLNFDGLTARFDGDVSLRTATQTAQTPTLLATLNRRLDFQQTSGQQQPELAHVLLDGGATGVYVESRGYDEANEQASHEQLRARNLAIDRLAGTLHAAGPGWVSTVRKSGAIPGGPAATAQPPVPPAAGDGSLISVHVAFEREIEGRMAEHKLEFRQQVTTTYAPTSDFNNVVIADPLAPLADRMFLMQSDLLTITEFTSGAARWIELQATGNTQVRGAKFQVEAPSVSYASDKETITLLADGRAKARIFAEQALGGARGWMDGDLFRYNLRSSALITDGMSNIRVGLPGGIKMPLPGAPRPQR